MTSFIPGSRVVITVSTELCQTHTHDQQVTAISFHKSNDCRDIQFKVRTPYTGSSKLS